MRTVKLEHGKVCEIIPEYALPVETWYGAEFAKECVEAPDNVEQGYLYDPVAKTFSPPTSAPVPDNPEADEMEALLDLKARVIQLELGTGTTT